MAAEGLTVLEKALAEVAVVEPVGALVGEGAEGLGEVGDVEAIAGLEEVALGLIDLASGFAVAEDGGEEFEAVGFKGVEAVALFGVVDGGGAEGGEGEASEALVDVEDACDRARCGDGAEADVEVLAGVAEVDGDGVEVGFGVTGLGGLGEEVEEDVVALGGVGEAEAAAAEAGEHGFDDAGGEEGGDRGVEGVAAFLEGKLSGFDGFFVTCGDRTCYGFTGYCWDHGQLFFIDISTMSHFNHYHRQRSIFNAVNNPVVTQSHPVLILAPFEFFASCRSRLFC